MKKLLLILCAAALSCNNKEKNNNIKPLPDVDVKTIEKNIKQYVTVQLEDVDTIDSLWFTIDSLTPKKKILEQAHEYHTAGLLWQFYEPHQFLDSYYSKDYAQKKMSELFADAEKMRNKAINTDSTTLLLWDITFNGLYTKKDVTQHEFMGSICMTKDLKVVKRSNVFDYPHSPYKVSPDRILDNPYEPYRENDAIDSTSLHIDSSIISK